MEADFNKPDGIGSDGAQAALLQELPGRAVGRYQIDEQLRQTQVGVVFMAHHLRLNMPVTIEVINPALLENTPGIAPQLIGVGSRLERLDHPNIVHLLECGEASGLLYVVMEYVDGITVAELLRLNGQLDELHALAVVQTVARALVAAHELKIVHGDVSPSQIIVTKTRRLKLGGFSPTGRIQKGFASITGRRGVTQYDAPEWHDNAPLVDTRADIYSLGATLYHLLTGMAPYKGRTPQELERMHREGDPVAPIDIDEKMDPEVSKYVGVLMSKTPKNRPANVEAVCEEIEALLEGLRDDVSGSAPSARVIREIQNLFGGSTKSASP